MAPRAGAAGASLAIAGLLVLAGCGSSSKTASTATSAQAAAAPATAAPTTAAPTTAAPATAASAAAALGTRSTALGVVVVDANGRTLYRFDRDTAGSNTSACTGSCSTTWPPAAVTGTPTAGAGITGTVGVITRSDGTQQLTLDGHPLYRFSGDQAPGDTHGNGIGGIWHAVLASGAAPAAPATRPSTTASGGYRY
jgi:predicted lipoprotein with Yx(FWY)xxD motif